MSTRARELLSRINIIERGLGWLGILPTTPATIVVGLYCAVVYVHWALFADSLGRPLSELTIQTLGLFIASMLTAGVTQFAVKRHTDDKAIAAKRGLPTEPRDARSTVSVTRTEVTSEDRG